MTATVPAAAQTAPTTAVAGRGPIDRRLLRLSRPVRWWIVVSAALAITRICAVVMFGVLLGRAVAALAANPAAGFTPWPLLAVAAVQIAVIWAERRVAHRAAAHTVADLRGRALARLAVADPRTVAADAPRWRAAIGAGLDALEPYLTSFLPALAAAAVGVPAVLAVIMWLDPTSALVAAVTVPLIPLFMVLVGLLTKGLTKARLAGLAALTDQLMDLVAGLPTLRAYGRIAGPAAEVQRLARVHREATMRVLRIAFLSAVVLEFFATLSVALVAVGIGLRLVAGELTLAVGLTVLIIVPEVYAPLRALGASYHAAVDGAEGWGRVLDLLDEPEPAGTEPARAEGKDVEPAKAPAASAPAAWTLEFRDLSVAARDGLAPASLNGRALPGQLTVLAGPNGSGKSTALLALLGVLRDGLSGSAQAYATTAGSAAETGTQSQPIRGAQFWQHVAWLPQRGDRNETLADASRRSSGQRQRDQIIRELAAEKTVWLLDEPTAHLDAENAAEVVRLLREGAQAGRTVLVASHDPLLLDAADSVVAVHRG